MGGRKGPERNDFWGKMQDVLFICDTTRPENGQLSARALFDAVKQGLARDPIDVQLVSDMTIYDQPVSLGLRGVGKAGYLFADLGFEDAEDAVALARLYVAAKDGEISDARSTGRLHSCLLGKIPAV